MDRRSLLVGAAAVVAATVLSPLDRAEAAKRQNRKRRGRKGKRSAAGGSTLNPGLPAIATITIPVIGLTNFPVYAGVEESVHLKAGVGWHPASAPLNTPNRTATLFGHRTTRPRPFRNLHLVKPGSDIIVTMPDGTRHLYKAGQQVVVDPERGTWIFNNPPAGKTRLVLSTCHPPGTTRFRLCVFAEKP